MEKLTINIPKLCADIQRVAPSNNVEYIGNGLTLNGIEVKIGGNFATFKNTKLRFSSLHELLKTLKIDGVLDATREDMERISSRPSNHSHSL